MEPAVKLFLSYAHADKTRREEFRPFLEMLSRECEFAVWVDTMIQPGDPWNMTIMKSLEDAQIIVLLISPDFMLSKFCSTLEMEIALRKHKSGQAIVIPVMVRPLPD